MLSVRTFFWTTKFSFSRTIIILFTVTADSCLGDLVVMTLAWNVRDQASVPVEALNFSVGRNPLLHLVANVGVTDLFGQSVRTRFPQRGGGGWISWQTVGLVVSWLWHLPERPGFNPRWGTEFFGPSVPTVTLWIIQNLPASCNSSLFRILLIPF